MPDAGLRTRKDQQIVGDGLVPSRRVLRARSRMLPHSPTTGPIPCGIPARATARVAPGSPYDRNSFV